MTAWLLASALFVGGCAALQADPLRLERENAELRRMLVETRREMEELRHDQERLRAAVEYLQYGKAAAERSPDGIVARSTGGYEAPGRSWPAGRWPGEEPTGNTGPERLPYGSTGDLRTSAPSGVGPKATVTTQTEGPGPLAGTAATPDMTEPQPGSATDNPGAQVVMGVREGGDWNEPGNVSAPPAPTVPPQLEGTLYADGVRAMGAEQYDEAIQFFRDFIHLDSTSPAADDAQFWIAECYRRKGMETAAIKEFNQVVLRYGSGDRGPAALLQLAAIFSKIGDQVDARLSLQQLINRYPRSREAQHARVWLQQMGG